MQQPTKATLPTFTVVERAIIYARVSTDEQAETGTSLDNQVEKSLAYARSLGLQVAGVFREDYTGKVLERPELAKVRELLRAGQAEHVIAYKTNRLDRSEWGLNLLILMAEFKQLGVKLHYSEAGRQIDLSNPMEAFMYGSFAGWQAGEDHRETVEKLHLGRLNRARSGYIVPNGQPPYGYKKVSRDKRYYFEIVEDEATTVRLMFKWYVEGDGSGQTLPLVDVAIRLNTSGLLTRAGKKWSRATVRYILTSETYCGVWRYRKEGNPIESTIPVPVPAIVDRTTWEVTQRQLEYNKAHAERSRKPGRYLLASRVTCGCCGFKMFGNTRREEHRYYVCRNKTQRKERARPCDNPGFAVAVVDSRVWGWLEEISQNRDKLLAGLHGYQAEQESAVEPSRRELELVEALLREKAEELEEEMDNLKVLTSRRAKAKKAVEIEQIEAILDGLEAKQARLQAEIETHSLTEEQIMGITVFIDQVTKDLATLREAEAHGKDLPELRLAVYEAKRRLLAMLDVQVTLFIEGGKRKAKVTAKVCPDGDTLELGNI